MSHPARDPYESLAIIAIIAVFFLVVLGGCAPIPPLQAGPYWFKSAEPSTLPEHVVYSYKPPVDCPAPSGITVAGLACGPAIRDGKQVFLIWIDSSYPRDWQNCFLNHERAHMAGWHHAQRRPSNISEHCAYEIGDFRK